MKVVCVKENLRRALGLTAKVVSSTTTLPVLNNVLLKTGAGQLLISATNLEIAAKIIVGAQVEETGEITVPARTLTDYVGNLDGDKITLKTEGNDLTITSERAKSVLKGLPAEDFPLIPEITPRSTVRIEAKELADALGHVAFATAYSETQPELSGVLFEFDDKSLYLAATDRYRLAEKHLILKNQVEQLRVIVPNRAVGELMKILGETEREVEMLIAENQVMFRTATSEFISRVIEAQYPDYRAIIPKGFTTTALLETSQFASAVKLAGLFAQDNNNIELAADPETKEIVINSASQKFGSNTARVKGDIEGEKNQIVFNYRYLLDCLTRLPSEKIRLQLINSSAPAMITPEGDDSYLYLVMPIKT